MILEVFSQCLFIWILSILLLCLIGYAIGKFKGMLIGGGVMGILMAYAIVFLALTKMYGIWMIAIEIIIPLVIWIAYDVIKKRKGIGVKK